MSTTITVRTEAALRDALAKCAEAQGKTVSALVREILEAALVDGPLGSRAGHLRGRLQLPKAGSEPWRRQLRQRNWRS